MTKQIDEVKKAEQASKALVRTMPTGFDMMAISRISKTDDPAATFEQVSAVRVWASEAIKQLDAERKDIIKGAQDTVKKVNAKMKQIREAQFQPVLDKADALLNGYADELRKIEEKKAARTAKRLIAKGDKDRAKDVLAAAEHIAPLALQSSVLDTRENWSAQVNDLGVFLEAAPTLCKQDGALREKLVTLIESHYRSRAIKAKRKDFGVPGVTGVASTMFAKKRGV